jgi:hypothetical protein
MDDSRSFDLYIWWMCKIWVFGKYIIWTNSNFKNGKPVVGVVVGCNYWVTLTIIDANDHNIYYICDHGPLSPLGKKFLVGNPDYFKQAKYDERFKIV